MPFCLYQCVHSLLLVQRVNLLLLFGKESSSSYRRSMSTQPKTARYHAVQRFTTTVATVDVLAAASTAACSSMPVSIIDKSIMDAMLGRSTSVWAGVTNGVKTLTLRPHKFFLPCAENSFAIVYWLVYLTYITTYSSGNIAQSYFEAQHKSYYLPKFTAGSVTNILFTLIKDNAMLSVLSAAKLPVPNVARALILARDVITVWASFVMAPIIGKQMHQAFPSYLSPKQASDAADLLIPTGIQSLTTIFHLYAIGLKEYPKDTAKQLFARVRLQYFSAFRARVMRIGISFGIGMIVNKRVRDWGLLQVDK